MGAEVGLGEEQEGLLAEAIFAALDRGEGVAALALDLVGVEDGLEQDLGEQLEGRLQAFDRRLQGGAEAAAAAEAVDLRGQALGGAREVGRRVAARAAQPHRGQEVRQARRLRVFGEQPAQEGRARRHHGDAAARDHVELRPVAQGVAVDLRARSDGAGTAKARALLSTPRCTAAAMRASSNSRAAASDITAPTVKRSGSRYSRATRCRSAAVALPHGVQVAGLGSVVAGDHVEASELVGESR